MRKIRPNLEWALVNYKDAVEWQERVPTADIQDVKLIKRTYTEEDITPNDQV